MLPVPDSLTYKVVFAPPSVLKNIDPTLAVTAPSGEPVPDLSWQEALEAESLKVRKGFEVKVVIVVETSLVSVSYTHLTLPTKA